MSEGDSAMEQARNDHKLWGKHKWRGKLFSSEEKEGKYLRQQGNFDDSVADFLHSPSENTSAGQQQQHATLLSRIETSTSSRWPSAAQVSNLSAEMPLYPRRKLPRNKNAHVTFESAAPEIIGEGGDEAELPSLAISRSRKSSKPKPHSHDQPVEQAAKSVPPLLRKDHFPGTVAPAVPSVTQAPELVSLRRKPTRVENARDNEALQTGDSGTGEGIPNSSGATRADVPQERLPDVQDAGEYTSRSENPTTPAVRKGFRVEVEAPPSQQGTTPSYDNADTRRQDDTSLLHLSSLEPALPLGNSLTPIPSPRPAQKLTPSSYPFPSSRQVETTLPQIGSAITQRQYHPQAEDSPMPASEARPYLKRIARTMGDDAIEDFGARVQRFNEVFRLGTTASGSLIEASFTQWTRICAWWFLKGRQELESAVRSRPRSGDGSHGGGDMVLSPELKQAYLDLAKAWWISKEITPGHSELRKYGDASMSSLVAIVGSFGNTRLAEVIEVHLGITANMRALAMSMKRNNKLPPDDFEIHRLVSRVWIQYAILSATTRSLLSGRSPRSLVSATPDDVESHPPITVGDTKHYFNYGSMFVETSLIDGQAELRLPCLLTILRGRSSWDLDFTTASQDGQVNIVVQNSREAGVTWGDVHWNIKMYTMQITLTDRFTVDVHFSEKDFKSLWGIRNYTQKVLKGFQCGETEKFVFETSVKCFQFFSPKAPQIFPAEPIKACKLRIFEKTVVFIEGTGKRRVHDGHRLVVITPSTVKTLSSMVCDFGKQTPILFTYLRGEDDAPAMLLKLLESGPDSSMVITFHESSERRLFHALLDGTSMTNEECCSACMPLKGLLISPKLAEEASSHFKGSFLADFRWHQLRVMGKTHEDEDHGVRHTLRSESLRIWADSDMGTIIDRINLGRYISNGVHEESETDNL
jgi:hypothetical protein